MGTWGSTQTEYNAEGPQRGVRGDAAQPSGAGDGDAFAVGKPVPFPAEFLLGGEAI